MDSADDAAWIGQRGRGGVKAENAYHAGTMVGAASPACVAGPLRLGWLLKTS
jgi:hypothetical protein